MAVAAQYENVLTLANTNTFGPGRYYFQLVAGSDTATLTISVTGGSDIIVLSATAGTMAATQECVKIGNNITATVALTGTSPKAYAIMELR